jgi:uncharacterized membrane protein YdcZ (DUF606 family)
LTIGGKVSTVVNELHTVSPVAAVSAGPDIGGEPWWPYVPALVGAALVAFGAMLFTPDSGTAPTSCSDHCAPLQSEIP